MDYITEIELARDHRYMRGKGNIQVRKKRFKKGVVKWFLYLLAFIFALALLLFTAKEIYLYFSTTRKLFDQIDWSRFQDKELLEIAEEMKYIS